MSFINAGGMVQFIHQVEDKRCMEEWWLGEAQFQPPILYDRLQPEESDYGFGFVNPWWPYAGNLLGGGPGGGDSQVINYPPWWQEPWVRSGCNGRLGLTGITRDQYGSPLGGCTVKLFRTSTDELVASVTSNGDGAYLITTPYHPDTHYLVVYKAGSPDTFGTTVNTLIPG